MIKEEMLDIVDEQDKVVGRKTRSEIYQEGLAFFRVVNVFLVNSDRKLWIPRRTAHKKIFPLSLDVSMGGHVESGESYEDALKRELHEELNIAFDQNECTILGYLFPHIHDVSAFMKVYQIKTDKSPLYNPDDFSEAFWFSPTEVLSMIEQGEQSKDDLPKLIRKFYV